jgi:hypothetical protein
MPRSSGSSYIERWLKAPAREEGGQLVPREKGTPQGGVITPRTQKVIWRRRGSLGVTEVWSGRPAGAGLWYRNGVAQRDRIGIDENLWVANS